jgi:D-alanyl-D-alanine carboxypeptidase
MISSLISLYLSSLLTKTPQISLTQSKSSAYADVLTAFSVPSSTKSASTSTATSTPTGAIDIQASSYLAMDLRSNRILAEKNTREKRSIGSITKLMTALIILDENDINEVVKIPIEATQAPGSRIWLAQGEKITIKDLLYGTLIHSGNDAAYALAIHNAGSVEKFTAKMNEKAQKLGLTQTHFGNPAGLDVDNNSSTSYDVSQLGVYAYRNNFIRHAVATAKITIISTNGQFKHELKSTNNLLEKDPRIKGLKTGYTIEAGKSFVGIATVKNGSPILTVILDSPDRFKETETLVDWVENNFIW